jgi:UDP-N-acetylmuramoyl-tripeptide--D-alanyl-D-alanine ligase
MIKTSMSEIAEKIGAEMIGEDVDISTVFTDSRREDPNGLFVALKGPHFDAHRFVDEMLDSGASGVVVEHLVETDKTQIVVSNTRLALAEIARLNRNKSQAKYIAITGSSGKTTVKEMVASILQLSGKTFATLGNLNNDIGVPLTLLDIDETIEFGVVELGANHAGEVAFTADITRPDVALVNNVSAAHLEGFGDLHGVASAKREIYSALSQDGVAVLNGDDDFFDYFQKKIIAKKMVFSVKADADVMAKNIQLNENQSSTFELHYKQQLVTIRLPIVGRHNVANALAAASCCLAVGISLSQIAAGLKNTPVVAGRLAIHQLGSGCRMIDDTYNANVASMKAAIDLLSQYPAPKILVLGDMAELGESGRQYHQQVGEYAKQAGIDKLFSCGVLTQFSQMAFTEDDDAYRMSHQKQLDRISDARGQHFNHQKELVKKLKQEAIAGATILIKGSRSAHMENIVQALLENVGDGDSKISDLDSGLNSNPQSDPVTKTGAASIKGGN